MSDFGGWLNAETMRLIGIALLHFLWQGVAIAAAAFMVMTLVRRAAGKYVVAVGMLAVMLASPVITFLLLAQRERPRVTSATGSTGLTSVAISPLVLLNFLIWAPLLRIGVRRFIFCGLWRRGFWACCC
jgi:hypothetical protein